MLPAPKQGMSTGCIVALVVGLVVVFTVVVLAVLAYVGIAGGRTVIEKARELQSKATMKSIEIAIKSFETAYSRLPMATNPPPALDGDAYDSSDPRGMMMLDVLLAMDHEQNPREIRFWDPPVSGARGGGYSASLGLIDPWGRNGYLILLDDNGDGRIADPEKVMGDISGPVLIYSAGADGDFLTWKDNVCSWK